ncbi:aminoglycoside phosphotransferase family protein [Gorillibacterium massiliense]|uniref:aminoglycoside phosphotransferase family protein n=1 Tax=Gorillibacterium massiliense TaxID=1280390 RepID=UPI0004B2728F|nr:aminoglycoside phosphotransferase family protein [Gorillibacterium massiliense]
MMEEIAEKLKEIFGDINLVRLTGGYTNLTFLVEGTNPLLVAKVVHLSNEDTMNEVNCLNFLQGTGVTPIIHDVVDISSMRIVLMDYKNGIHGQSILDSEDWERGTILYKGIGKLLALQIHTNDFNGNDKGIRKSNIAMLKDADLDLDYVPVELTKQSKEILCRAELNEEQWVLTHGDYGSHNVLFETEHNVNILDWEWAEWGNPLNDIAWVCWFTKLHYSEKALLLITAFINEYISHYPLVISSEQLKACCVYKVWNILIRVSNAPVEVQNEWVRRLEWTIKTDFSDVCQTIA